MRALEHHRSASTIVIGTLAATLCAGCTGRVGYRIDCTPVPDSDLCRQRTAECGEILVRDNCAKVRSVDCGSCTPPEICAGGGVEHRCASPTPPPLMFTDSTQADFAAGVQAGLRWNTADRVLENDDDQTWELDPSWIDTRGLVGLWHLNEQPADGSTNNVIIDSSGNGRQGVLTTADGATSKSAAGQLRGAIAFDGIDDRITVAHQAALAPTAAMTVHAWFKTNDLAQSGLLVSKREQAGWKMGFRHFDCPTDTFCLEARVGAAFQIVSYPAARFTADRWHHAVGTYDGETLRLYVNGVLVDEETAPSGDIVYVYENPVCIGEEAVYTTCGEGGAFDGLIDEVALWNRALTADEVATIFLHQAPSLSGRFRSRVFDAEGPATWTTIGWSSYAPYEKALLGQGISETVYSHGLVAMNDNVLLLHLEDDAGTEVFGDDSIQAHSVSCAQVNDECPVTGTEGRLARAAVFDGVDDLIRVDHQPILNAFPISLTAWFKTMSGDNGGILSKHVEAVDDGYQIFLAGGDLCARYFGPTAGQAVTDGTPCPMRVSGYNDGRWHQVVFVVDANGGRLFVDGSARAAEPWQGVPAAAETTADLLIGHCDPRPDAFFRGLIDEVAIWARALTDTEVASLFQRGATRLRFRVRTCTDGDCVDGAFVGPDGSANSFFSELWNLSAAFPSFSLPSSLAPTQYFQYEAEFDSSDRPSPVVFPRVSSVSIRASR